ncbi:AGAP009963-PA [Anopheles gambiae str. PEST]|uniref:AGAP009963-PA n=1 Tax=Anopheles gambiae TaxID=7165 RepID=A0NFX9_ANOGA|nr:AGAP009963-PA [Anopheles gambiae str. PEST]
MIAGCNPRRTGDGRRANPFRFSRANFLHPMRNGQLPQRMPFRRHQRGDEPHTDECK